MSSGAAMLSSLVVLSLWAASGLTSAADTVVPPLGISSPDSCLSSPLLAAQTSTGILWQCSSNTALNKTTHSLEQDASPSSQQKEEEEEEESSGGWTGPHLCAGMYCVYANPAFAAGRGIVVISDGEAANALANLPMLTKLAGPEASSMLKTDNINVQSQGVETQDITDKGRGFVATRPIIRGEQILAYTPALVIHRAFVDDLDRAEQLRLLRDAVSHLPRPTRVVFWRQLGQTHHPGDDDILDIVMNNSFNLPLNLAGAAREATFIGNFPEVSMFNHDCRPNVAFHLDGGLIHRTHAVRKAMAIQPGEELSISYVDAFRARDVRRARTERNWGFKCACAQCTLPEALVNASDHRLWRIYEVQNELVFDESTKPVKAKKGEKMTACLDAVELLLSLYEQERLLDSHGSPAYRIAALNYNAFRRRELAVKYALLALEAHIVEDGARSEGVKDMVALLDEPEEHWSWGKKVRSS